MERCASLRALEGKILRQSKRQWMVRRPNRTAPDGGLAPTFFRSLLRVDAPHRCVRRAAGDRLPIRLSVAVAVAVADTDHLT